MGARPQRIQLRRTKGWRMPENTVKVDRSTRFGSPFTVAKAREAGIRGSDEDLAAICVRAFREWVSDPSETSHWIGPESLTARARVLDNIDALRGKNLACWCKLGAPCHADVLLEIANQGDT